MFGHLPELVIIMVIALIVFGPEKLPEAAASAGKMIREVRQALDGAMNPAEEPPSDEFSTYYYESLARSGEAGAESTTVEEAAEIWPHPGAAVAGTELIESSLPEAESVPNPLDAAATSVPDSPGIDKDSGKAGPSIEAGSMERPPTT